MFGHQHSHGNNVDMNAMQKAFMAMRAKNNGNIPAFPPNMTPQMMQDMIRNQMINMQNNNSMNPPIPMQFNINGNNPMAQNKPATNSIENQETLVTNGAIVDEDYSKFDIVKATQYGSFERCKELIESGLADVNHPDAENVFLLHWAAINNRIEIARYFIEKGAIVDAIGGELESTPLHWATRHGHIKMVILLLNAGADHNIFDNEGFSTIHLATMFGHSMIVAYLLARGIDPDMLDKNNATPLMYAAQRIHNRDPAQLLLTYNARINAQDVRGNTPLHYSIQFNNSVVLRVLLDKGASLEIKNNNGLDAIQFAEERKKTNIVFLLHQYLVDDKNNLPTILKPLSTNKNFRKLMTQIFPFFTLFYFGILFDMQLWIIYKLFFAGFFYLVFFTFKLLFFDKHSNKYVPIATTMSFIFWLYTTWFIYFRPILVTFSVHNLLFLIATCFSWYNFYKAWKTNPGIVNNNRSEMNKSILQFMERDDFSLEQFCTSCVVRKPLRSKHCSECDQCVSKFDHHCPWVDNCIGEFNLKYFIGFLFWTPICLAFYLDGAIEYMKVECMVTEALSTFQTVQQIILCSPWVTFFTLIAGFNMFWISCLFICHIYQAVFVALTTNERMNSHRYKHFTDESGKFQNPFNFGIIQNIADVFEINFGPFKQSQISWLREHDIKNIIDSKHKRRAKKSFSNV